MNDAKRTMLYNGIALAGKFCEANSLPMPEVIIVPSGEWWFQVCAYYRPTFIRICVERCAHVGTAGMQWSYPGYIADRTPYGVIAHEIGHHADRSASTVKRDYWGDYSEAVRKESREPRLTSYAPNDAEWFAEMFRLFITNPELLRHLRPRTWAIIRRLFVPVVFESWETVLQDAPLRTQEQAARKVEAAAQGKLS